MTSEENRLKIALENALAQERTRSTQLEGVILAQQHDALTLKKQLVHMSQAYRTLQSKYATVLNAYQRISSKSHDADTHNHLTTQDFIRLGACQAPLT
jgi:hypothetical protein